MPFASILRTENDILYSTITRDQIFLGAVQRDCKQVVPLKHRGVPGTSAGQIYVLCNFYKKDLTDKSIFGISR
jgi:hypothetical protein